MSGINFLTDVEGFLAAWGRPVGPVAPAVRRVGKPARKGTGAVYSCSHPAFHLSLEPGVREVVLSLIKSLDCVTYSSCEGHRATVRTPMRCSHVGILARSPKEHIRLSRILRGLARRVNHRVGRRAPSLRIEERRLDSETSSWPCLDVLFVPNGLPEETYFARLPGARRVLIDLICKQDCKQAQRERGRDKRSAHSRIVDALATPSIPELRKQFRSATPYPHLCLSGLLTRSEAAVARAAIPEYAWNRVERERYQFEVVDLLARTSRRYGLQSIVEALASQSVRNALSTITGRPRLALDALHVHRMSRGQSVSVHTDSEGHASAARLVIYLDDRRPDQGGVHLLLRERSRDYVVENYVVPRAGLALLFPMNRQSFHAVTPLTTARNRYTLVATYVSSNTTSIAD